MRKEKIGKLSSKGKTLFMKSRGDSKVRLELKKEGLESWVFSVVIIDKDGKHNFEVELDKKYHKEITNGSVLPIILIQESMFFLLERENVSTILKEFNIKEISNYFGEYESEIKKHF